MVGKTGFPEDDSTLGNGVAPAPDGGAYVAGASFGAGADPNLVVVQFDAAGNFIWQKIGGPGFGSAEDVAVGADGRVHVTGQVLTDGGATGSNAFVWTLSAAGKGTDAAIPGCWRSVRDREWRVDCGRTRWRTPRRGLRGRATIYVHPWVEECEGRANVPRHDCRALLPRPLERSETRRPS